MAPTRKTNWIVTGATGFIGREFVYQILKYTSDSLTLLLRHSPEGTPPAQRIDRLLNSIDPIFRFDRSRLNVLTADIEVPSLGLPTSELLALVKYKNAFVHLAANTQFTTPLKEAKSINLDGVKHAIDVAHVLQDNGCLISFNYVSTAYVHGACDTIVTAAQPLVVDGLRNNYETSKCLAEQYVREQTKRLPVVIFRPSIVVGDSITGRSSGCGTVYWALKRYRRGQRRFYANKEARLDIVPVDYVVQALAYLAVRPTSRGQCFPLVAGQDRDITLGHLATLASEHLDQPMPKLIAPRRLLKMKRLLDKLPATEQLFFQQMLAYLPYFSCNPRFDASVTERALSSSTIRCPAFDDYAELIIRDRNQTIPKTLTTCALA